MAQCQSCGRNAGNNHLCSICHSQRHTRTGIDPSPMEIAAMMVLMKAERGFVVENADKRSQVRIVRVHKGKFPRRKRPRSE